MSQDNIKYGHWECTDLKIFQFLIDYNIINYELH